MALHLWRDESVYINPAGHYASDRRSRRIAGEWLAALNKKKGDNEQRVIASLVATRHCTKLQVWLSLSCVLGRNAKDGT